MQGYEGTDQAIATAPPIGAPPLLDIDAILAHPHLAASLRQQATTLVGLHGQNPRIASVFATQQRWLLAHAAFRCAFDDIATGGDGCFVATSLFQAATHHGVASRNTADAFLKEMLKYGYLENSSATDRRTRPLRPAPIAVAMISVWLSVHLTTLDALDGGTRAQTFAEQPALIAAIHPRIADGLLRSAVIRAPQAAFSLFTWMNEGGVVMDWLCAGLDETAARDRRVPSRVTSIGEFASRVTLSRTHLTRSLRMAESMGSLGWLGRRGHSTMWVSADFLDDYHRQQAAKLGVISSAYDAAIAAAAANAPN